MRALRLLLASALLAAPLPAQLAAQLAAQPAPAVDHAPWDSLLRAHVTDGLVDYDAFARSAAFRGYLARLARTDPAALPRDEQLALWINAYNAYTIQLVVRHGERTSIRNINRTLGIIRGGGPWKEPLAVVGGRRYTLDDIEHGIIRPRFRDARIHFALVCAARGCPPLRAEAYTGARLDAQLDDQGHRFLRRSPAKNRVDVATRTVYLSPIFLSFRDYIDDFGGSPASVGRYVARWFEGSERALLLSGEFRVVETGYDWGLNIRPPGG